MADAENPDAGQGAVVLDIGGDVGALVVIMPEGLDGVEIEIRPLGRETAPSEQDRGHGHGHGHGHGYAHVAVVNRPVGSATVPSLVFPDLVEGDYVLVPKGGGIPFLNATVHGGEVTEMQWPDGVAAT